MRKYQAQLIGIVSTQVSDMSVYLIRPIQHIGLQSGRTALIVISLVRNPIPVILESRVGCVGNEPTRSLKAARQVEGFDAA